MRYLKALIFDVDGTLAQTEVRGHLVAFNLAFEAKGLPWRWSAEEYAHLLSIGGGRERLLHFLSQQADDAAAKDRLDLAADLHRLKTQYYRRIVAAGELPLRSGVRRLVVASRDAGVRLAIATTSSLESVSSLLQSALGERAGDFFDCIAAGDVVAHKKPAPDIYRYALERLDLDADAAVAIEDSVPGLRAAREAGLAVVVTPSEFTRGHDFAGAAAVVDRLGDPAVPCRQYSGCVELRPMVTLENLEQLLTASRSPEHGA